MTFTDYQPVREAVNDRGLFTAGWFGVREKHCFRLEIYDRLRASKQALCVYGLSETFVYRNLHLNSYYELRLLNRNTV